MVQDTKKLLGERLRAARERAGYTQLSAAQAIGKTLSPQTWLSTIERGRNDISTDDLLALARLYGVPVGKLVGEREPVSENILARLGDVVERLVAIPVLDLEAHAGAGGDTIVDYVYREVPKDAVGHRLAAVRVKGDCLSPEIIEGDLLTLDMDRTATPGKLIVIAGEGAPRVCRYQMRNGEPVGVNNDGVVILKDVRIVGVVIQRSRDM